ncbi:MAG: LLM class F420-dependent oxidoreductase [Thermoleophilaceae bacterium]
MLFGLAMFPADYAAPPDEVAVMAEQRGFHCLLFPEHTHIPASRDTPYPAGGDLPDEYRRTLDPFVACTAAAAATTTLLVGTGICLVVERDPIVTAKAAASVDHLSGGRFLFGVGAGWNVEEMANHGTDASRRFGLMRERVEAIKAIWTEEEASYHGSHVDFDRIWSWPKPIQDPHPPVLLGGNGRTVGDRVLAFADEWMPNRVGDDEKIAARIEKLIRRGRDEAGRDIAVTLSVAPTEPELIERYERAGVHRCVWYLPPRDPASVERALDRYAAVVSAYTG